MTGSAWQELRRYVEDTLVLRDPFELFVAQNVALDGLLYPLVYEHIVDRFLASRGASSVAMLTLFMSEWFDETRKWVDAVVRVAAGESDANRDLIQQWTLKWSRRASIALQPIVQLALDDDADAAIAKELVSFKARMKKNTIEI